MPDFITFNDGIVELCKVENIAEKGDAIKNGLVLYNKYRFGNKTIGMNRHFIAMQYDVEIKKVIRIPAIDDKISTQNVAVVNGSQYEIIQIQHITNKKPKHTLLTLSDLEEKYETTGF